MTTLTAEQNEILDLRDRVFELEEEVRDLRKLIAGNLTFPIEWRLQRAETKVLSALVSSPSGYRSNEALASVLSSTSENPVALVKVRILFLRRKLRPLGIEIATRWGEGYELPAASKRAISAALEARR